MNTAAAWQIDSPRGLASRRPVWTGALARLAVGLGLLAAVAAVAVPQDLLSGLGEIDPAWVGPTFFLYAASLLLRGVRWWFLMRSLGAGAHWLDVSCISTLGWSLNNLLPLRLGDAVRPCLLSVRTGLSLPSVLPSLVAERLLDVSLLTGVLAAGLLVTPAGAGALTAVSLPFGKPGLWIALAAGAGCAAVALRHCGSSLWKGHLGSVFAHWKTVTGAGRALMCPGALSGALGLTLAGWALQAAQYYVWFRAFDVAPPVDAFALGFAAFMLSFAINIIPGQLGSYELLFVGAFSAVQVADPPQLVVVALAAHVSNMLFLSILGLLSYAQLGFRGEAWGQVRRAMALRAQEA